MSRSSASESRLVGMSPLPSGDGHSNDQTPKPMISLVVPAHNEAAILQKSLLTLCQYMESIENEYRWEIVLVNDGSKDETGPLAEAIARTRENIRVLHHGSNFGLGQALRSAFNVCRGDYVITLDADMSYSPDHIERLLAKIKETGAKIVIASPYTKGGNVSHVPWLRRLLSVWANRFLSLTSRSNLSTLTGMVRAYDGRFVRALDLRSLGMDVSPETIYKAMILRARIDEIPAHLDWSLQTTDGVGRSSSMKKLRHIASVLVSGFLFKPFLFFILPGLGLLLFSLYVNAWMFIHFFNQYQSLPHAWFLSRASAAVAAAYGKAPHTFIVGFASLMLAIQLISLGILSLQSKRYFEEIFHLGSTIYRFTREADGDRG